MALSRVLPACVLAFFAAVPALPQAKITYAGGQLTILARDVTVAELLRQVAAATGATVDLDVAPAAATERLPEVNVGPGPARSIVGALLAETGFDYLIQASDADPDTVRTILLMTRDKKDLSLAAARETAVARVEETPTATAAETPAAPPQETATATANAATDAPAAQASRIPIANQPLIQPAATPQLAPPSAVTPQAVNSQLLQMYQQRMQMVQQTRQQQ